MDTKRLLITLPAQTKRHLREYSALNHVETSVVVQQAITKMSREIPKDKDIVRTNEGTDRMHITFSDTGLRLLEMWSANTGLPKSKLIAYALQQTIENEESGGI